MDMLSIIHLFLLMNWVLPWHIDGKRDISFVTDLTKAPQTLQIFHADLGDPRIPSDFLIKNPNRRNPSKAIFSSISFAHPHSLLPSSRVTNLYLPQLARQKRPQRSTQPPPPNALQLILFFSLLSHICTTLLIFRSLWTTHQNVVVFSLLSVEKRRRFWLMYPCVLIPKRCRLNVTN